jgi:hypothetical protein
MASLHAEAAICQLENDVRAKNYGCGATNL